MEWLKQKMVSGCLKAYFNHWIIDTSHVYIKNRKDIDDDRQPEKRLGVVVVLRGQRVAHATLAI
ncbi:hypothetical protein [Wielerella bovis]|uniref:hypothetical protein n=1 Tax=Wielerella bovis TaxID=2917790 RepID=UPI0020190653|nr:hypothetical protein [Wielerella bovis]MCG7656597.1 hypothetical protein [Wielerella bovis]MCG7658822.1 hypothetical protein [Wielerella bovis]